jgi:hypothetical protein
MLALFFAGCIALGRESYTTLTGEGVTGVSPSVDVPVSRGRIGHGFAQDPSAARAHPDVLVSVCDWDPGFWLFVFPPIPLPLISNEDTPGLPNTTLVRLTFEGKGPWRAQFSDLAMVGADGARVTPIRYRVVLAQKAESIGDSPHTRELEPCARAASEPKKTVDRAHVAVMEAGELWLTFDSGKLPDGEPLALELDGISRDGTRVALPHLALAGGSRWFWYRVFP